VGKGLCLRPLAKAHEIYKQRAATTQRADLRAQPTSSKDFRCCVVSFIFGFLFSLVAMLCTCLPLLFASFIFGAFSALVLSLSLFICLRIGLVSPEEAFGPKSIEESIPNSQIFSISPRVRNELESRLVVRLRRCLRRQRASTHASARCDLFSTVARSRRCLRR